MIIIFRLINKILELAIVVVEGEENNLERIKIINKNKNIKEVNRFLFNVYKFL